MLNVRVGHDTDYLTEAVAKGREGYYTGAVAAGEPPGLWYGQGAEALGLTGEVDAEMMKALYTHGLDPRDPAAAQRTTWGEAARFGNPPRNYKKADEIFAGLLDTHPDAGPEEREQLRAQAARSARQSVAFYDVVLSAPKTMTVLWVAFERAANDTRAAGRDGEADEWAQRAKLVEESLMVGHRAVLDFYADKAGYARKGHHGGGGGQWVDAHGLIAAQFLQHDSRDKDPQLHVHGPVANKVQCADGKVRALDGSLLNHWKAAAAAVGERTAEAYLWEQLGVRWETRPDGKAREIVGIDAESTAMFSKRTHAIGPAMDGLVARFRADTGREPTSRERSRLADQATLVTRQGKTFGGETREGQIARWAAEHATRIGVELGDVARSMVEERAGAPATWSERDVIARALAGVAEAKQSWTRSDLQRAISDALPGNLGIAPARVLPLLDALTDKAEAQARHLNPRTGPQGLDAGYYRADGQSVFVKPGCERYATDDQLLGEAELRAAAVRRGAPAWAVEQADEVIARFGRGGRELGADQAAALRGILTSGAAVEVLAAPAGTGKSFLVGTLAETWPLTGRPAAGEPDDPSGAGEGPRVFGVAYGQRQADVLTEEGVTARNISKWLGGQGRLDAGRGSADDERFRLRSGDLLVVDEAGAADTAALVAIQRRCEQAGAKLLLVGDAKQLAAVGAGGALADIAERGIRYDLAEVRRFADEWEGPASLRLRDGDPRVVDEHAKHGRLIDAGTPEQAEAAASRAWLADTLEGRDALLVVGSNKAAARCSAALRAELVRLGRVQEQGVPLGMAEWEGVVAGVGDLVQARRNGWHLDGWQGNTEAPINRQTYRVTAAHPDGGLTVARVTGRGEDGAEQLADPLQLPASYVSQHVSLGYASTVHAAHGRTVGAGYSVLNPGTDAATAYTQHTRGRDINVMFVVTRNVADTAQTGETHKVAPRTAAEVLADVIRPLDEDPNRTALTLAEDSAELARATPTHVDPLVEVISDVIAGRTERWLDQLAADGRLAEHHRIAFAADEARSTLDQLLRRAELAGHDPAQVLTDAVTSSSLDGSTSVAQVLHFRIRSTLADQLGPRVAGYADLLPREIPDDIRPGLEALAAIADERRLELGAQLVADPPQWAREALGPVPDDAPDRAEWERRAGLAASYRELVGHTDDAEPLGAAPAAGLAEKHALFRAAHTALDLADVGADEEGMSEGQLRARIAAWDREQVWAPRYVADELEAAHDALRRHRTDATVWAARADAATDDQERANHQAAADAAHAEADRLEPIVAQLEAADAARAAWLVETAVTRDNAERSRVAAGLRGIDLDNPAERVTADEWLATEDAARQADDEHRAITQHDLELDRDVPMADVERGSAVEPAAPDIRDTATPDPTERAEPALRRRIPAPDEATAALDRAQRALTEITDRQEAEAAASAHAMEREPDDDDRLAELARWADDDRAETDELALER